MSKQAVLFGKNSDIGKGLRALLERDGWEVSGLGRDWYDEIDSLPPWDLFISAIGRVEPIGKFSELDFYQWRQSFHDNCLLQIEVLHTILPKRQPGADVMFFAGGATNGTFANYSAYAAAKITLIKMVELLHDEEEGLNAFILGPGYVKTKIHQQTIKAGREKAGRGYDKALNFLNAGPGTPIDDIYQHMRWCMEKGRPVAGGRNFSTVHDQWRNDPLIEHQVAVNPNDAFRLRRAR